MTRFSIPGPLPRREQILAWIVWISHSILAFIIAYWVSNGKLRPWIKHWLQDSGYIEGAKMDLADAEWAYYRQTIAHLLFDYSLHSIGYFLIKRFVSAPYSHYLFIVTGFVIQIHMTSLQCFLVLYSFATFVTICTILFRRSIIPWIMCISFIIKASQYVPFSAGHHIFYREFNLYLYGSIKILNFCLYFCSLKNANYKDLLIRNLIYYAYLPYSMTLIVIFDDFMKQFERFELQINRDWVTVRSNILFGIRLLFWFLFFEFSLHFIHVNALFNSPFTVINGLNSYEVCSVAYVAGQFFHLKYVVIFGVPSLFAYIDGMKPPPPPICISRVSLYSRMWRYFDNGLYQFLKHHVYIPVMRKPLPFLLCQLRNIGALVAVFGIVLAWHGTRTHYICWVLLSATELILERIGWKIWQTEAMEKLRSRWGENCWRRIIATLMISTVTPGIFGVFFFLGQEGIGETILQKVVVEGTYDVFILNLNWKPLTAGFAFLHILTLGYFYNNVCLDIEFRRSKIKNS